MSKIRQEEIMNEEVHKAQNDLVRSRLLSVNQLMENETGFWSFDDGSLMITNHSHKRRIPADNFAEWVDEQ